LLERPFPCHVASREQARDAAGRQWGEDRHWDPVMRDLDRFALPDTAESRRQILPELTYANPIAHCVHMIPQRVQPFSVTSLYTFTVCLAACSQLKGAALSGPSCPSASRRSTASSMPAAIESRS
jgi:hypothetical protein